MSCIYNGKIIESELSKNAKGGTELMRERILRDIAPDLLDGVAIHFSRTREIYRDVPNIYYAHDLAPDPEVQNLKDPEYRAQFEKIVFVSNWQQQMYNLILGVPYSQSVVIPNGIELPSSNITKSVDGPINLIYHTTPHRGLSILAAVMPELSKYFDIHLDVFSSFGAYGWNERDKHFSDVFEKLDNMKNVTNHGFKPNKDIRKHLIKADVFAYPSIWQETSCLALIEAMCFGVWCVHSNLAALPETSGGVTTMYNYNEDVNQHAADFFHVMYRVLTMIRDNRKIVNDHGQYCAPIAHYRFNWEKIKSNHWQPLLESIK